MVPPKIQQQDAVPFISFYFKGNNTQQLHIRLKLAYNLKNSVLPFPPAAWSIFKWSTVICKISAFSSLAEP